MNDGEHSELEIDDYDDEAYIEGADTETTFTAPAVDERTYLVDDVVAGARA